MATHLSVLIVEDSDSDAHLIVRLLKKAGYEVAYRVVETAAQMRDALAQSTWDIVISDYSLPQFDGPAALGLLKGTGLDIPFIAVSGTMGEETAVAMMKTGAHDYLMKDNMARLAPAVERELREAETRRERRRAEAALHESEEKHRTILQTAMDGFWLVDMSGRLLEVNETYCRMSGYNTRELLAMSIPDMESVEAVDETDEHIREVVARGEGRFETRHRRKDGSVFDVEVSVQFRPAGGGRMAVFLRDITDRKRAEEQIRRSLHEKDVLLREIHHRVRNNLNVITGLLSLQSSSIQTPEQAMEAFQKTSDRVMSMAMVHQTLYDSEDYTHIGMGEYMENLARHVLQVHGVGKDIRLSVQAEDVAMGVDAAVPCGLILNELVTNACKHAFPLSGGGEVRVSLRRTGDDLIELSVADDGVGMPEGRDAGDGGTLGLSLIEQLAKQIKGTVELSSGAGACCRVQFPRNGKPQAWRE